MAENIRICGLRKNFKGFTLENVSFDVPKGAVVGLIGENGAGKSTTIKSILGLVNPSGGRVEVFGKDAASLTSEEKGEIGAVLGETCLPENLDLKDIGGVMKHIFRHWDADKFYSLAERFSLPRDKKVREFSRGMRQKVSLSVALSHGARLLVLDEPTAGLDPVARDEILDMLYDFMQDEEHSILISSHILSDLEKLCDYIVFLHAGRTLFFEEKDRLEEKYAIFRGSEEEVANLGNAAVRLQCGEFGCSALVLREQVPCGTPLERAGIEDIMLYFVRGKENVRNDRKGY